MALVNKNIDPDSKTTEERIEELYTGWQTMKYDEYPDTSDEDKNFKELFPLTLKTAITAMATIGFELTPIKPTR